MNLERNLTAELERQARAVPSASGNMSEVKRRGRRDLFILRTISVTAAILVGAGAVSLLFLQGGSGSGPMIVADVHVFDAGFALSPLEEASHIVACLQEKGLDVTQEGTGITFDNTVVNEAEFEAGVDMCLSSLRSAGYLLPGDNPANIEIAYQQYEVLAECYRSAGIEISAAPDLNEFIAQRTGRSYGWSPQSEAIREVGIDATTEADRACHIPTPGELGSSE